MVEGPEYPLTARARWGLVLGGAVLGAVIGPAGFLLRTFGTDSSTFPGPVSGWRQIATKFTGTAGGFVFVAVAFIATLLLMPALVSWLVRQLHRTNTAFYLRAALAGILFGASATALTAALLMVAAVAAGYLSPTAPSESQGLAGAATLGIGTMVFAPLLGLATVPFFMPFILAFGIPFGLLFGAVLRHLSRTTGARGTHSV
jgi:MFS family permease